MRMPEGILCSKTHEWILEEENQATVGITDYIIEQLEDIDFIDLPEVGAKFLKGEAFGIIQSNKAGSELYMPVSGKVIEINEELLNHPEFLNDENYESWLVKIECNDFSADCKGLLEYIDYRDEIA